MEFLAVVIAATVAAIGGLWAARWQRPKINAEAGQLAVRSLTDALKVVRDEVEELRQHVAHLQGIVTELEGAVHKQRVGLDILTGQVRELGGIPRWPKE